MFAKLLIVDKRSMAFEVSILVYNVVLMMRKKVLNKTMMAKMTQMTIAKMTQIAVDW